MYGKSAEIVMRFMKGGSASSNRWGRPSSGSNSCEESAEGEWVQDMGIQITIQEEKGRPHRYCSYHTIPI